MREQLFTGKDEGPIKRTQAKEQLFTEKEGGKDREERLGQRRETEVYPLSQPPLFSNRIHICQVMGKRGSGV